MPGVWEMSDRTRTKQGEAEKRGHRIVAPLANQLFIDIDTKEQLEHFIQAVGVVNERPDVEPLIKRYVDAPSPSGEPFHRHITVTLVRDVEDERERILYQALLGSDPMRELLSYQELRMGDACPTVFF